MSYNAKRDGPPPRMPDRLPDTRPLPKSAPDSPAYLQFKAWWEDFKRNPPPCEHPDTIGTFVRLGAIFTASKFQPSDVERDEERRAIQDESDGI